MNTYQTYLLLGKILALDLYPGHREGILTELKKNNISWQGFVSLADKHLILQALYPKISDHNLAGFLPEELSIHLKYIFDLTTDRNLEVIEQATELNQALKKEGINPVFMKGVGNILDGVYLYPGERILHDIDILVPEEIFENAAAVLLKDGYQSNYQYKPGQKNPGKHYPILFKPGKPIYLELHRMPSNNRHKRYFSTESIFQKARSAAAYPECLVMSDEHKIIHNFIHAQLDHGARFYGLDFIRNFYDLLLLSKREDPEKVLYDFGHYRRASSGYLDITYHTFAITPLKRFQPRLFMHAYRFRYLLNLRFRPVRAISIAVWRLFALLKLLFTGFFVRPFLAIKDREVRMQLVSHLMSREWYKKQFLYYLRTLGIKRK